MSVLAWLAFFAQTFVTGVRYTEGPPAAASHVEMLSRDTVRVNGWLRITALRGALGTVDIQAIGSGPLAVNLRLRGVDWDAAVADAGRTWPDLANVVKFEDCPGTGASGRMFYGSLIYPVCRGGWGVTLGSPALAGAVVLHVDGTADGPLWSFAPNE